MLKKEYIKLILSDATLQAKIAQACKKSIYAPIRWAKEETEDLLLYPALKAIKEHTGVNSVDDLLEAA